MYLGECECGDRLVAGDAKSEAGFGLAISPHRAKTDYRGLICQANLGSAAARRCAVGSRTPARHGENDAIAVDNESSGGEELCHGGQRRAAHGV